MKAPTRSIEAFAQPSIASPQVASIVTTLRHDIVFGAIAPGSPLGQESLADRFGVSRMPIREAIRHLEAMGFVNVESNRRSRVAGVSLEDLTDIYEMRMELECLAMRSAIRHLTELHIDEAERLHEGLVGTQPLEFGSSNQAFHMALYRPCARPRLLAQVESLYNAADRYLCITRSPPSLRKKSDEEHLLLIEACRRRDADAALGCLRRHIGDALEVFAKQF